MDTTATTPQPWTKERIEKMILDKIEEGAHLDYKAAGALDRSEKRKADITKDVSSFANAAGGTIIYGVKEFDAEDKKHLPEAITPIDGRDFSKEWLEDITSGISPRIEDLRIFPVRVGPDAWQSCYVVEIPQSTTAHQARDFRYYRRYNFESVPMEDHEVRDVMGRRKRPKLEIKVMLTHMMNGRIQLAVRIWNSGTVMPKRYGVHVFMPIALGGKKVLAEDRVFQVLEGLYYWRRFIDGGALYPKMDVVHLTEFSYEMLGTPYAVIADASKPSGTHVICTLYAEDMDPIEHKILAAITKDWT
jgi:hypothetical protein